MNYGVDTCASWQPVKTTVCRMNYWFKPGIISAGLTRPNGQPASSRKRMSPQQASSNPRLQDLLDRAHFSPNEIGRFSGSASPFER
jgi:hypothetical protein